MQVKPCQAAAIRKPSRLYTGYSFSKSIEIRKFSAIHGPRGRQQNARLVDRGRRP